MSDVVVVGAGVAGSVTAREVARLGRKVVLLDKAHFPRLKVCGSCVNGAAVATLDRLGLGKVLHDGLPIHRVLVASKQSRIVFHLPQRLPPAWSFVRA